jgi:hypothetical protein
VVGWKLKILKTSKQLLTIKHFIMKKYLLGLFAVVLAIGFSSFTEISKHFRTTDTYYYIGADFQQSNVINAANYDKSVSSGTAVNCGSFTTATCRVVLPVNLNNGNKLDGSLVTIVPVLVSGSDYKVSDITDGSTSILQGIQEGRP